MVVKTMLLSSDELFEYIRSEIGIVNSPQYAMIANMDISAEQTAKISHSIHRLLEQRGEKLAFQKVLDIMRVNPLLAFRILESCSLCVYRQEIHRAVGILIDATGQHDKNVLLNDELPFVILLIEAGYQDLLEQEMIGEYILQQVKKADAKRHKWNLKSRHTLPLYLTSYHIRHIFNNIPARRQIELINWFWKQHCYAASHFQKTETYSSRRVDIMLREMEDSCLWKHLENINTTQLSETERQQINREKAHIREFIDNLLKERYHLPYLKTILGEDDFRRKLEDLMGSNGLLRYDDEVQRMPMYAQRIENQRRTADATSAYAHLTKRVLRKYLKASNDRNNPLGWYLHEKPELREHLGLWTMWQGIGFKNVKIMVLGLEWGCARKNGPERNEFMSYIFRIRRGSQTARYHLYADRPIDHNLAFLFEKALGRDICSNRYEDLFFSHLCLGYRKKADSTVAESRILEDVNEFLEEQVRLVDPDAIFCLGEQVHRLFWQGMQPDSEYPFVPGNVQVLEKNGIASRVYAMPDCSQTENSAFPIEFQLKVWKAVQQDMAQHDIYL